MMPWSVSFFEEQTYYLKDNSAASENSDPESPPTLSSGRNSFKAIKEKMRVAMSMPQINFASRITSSTCSFSDYEKQHAQLIQ